MSWQISCEFDTIRLRLREKCLTPAWDQNDERFILGGEAADSVISNCLEPKSYCYKTYYQLLLKKYNTYS